MSSAYKDIKQLNDEVYEFLMDKHKDNDDFMFRVRRNNAKNKLSNGYWFRGNDKYLNIGFSSTGGSWKTKDYAIEFGLSIYKGCCYIVLCNKKNKDNGFEELINDFELQFNNYTVKNKDSDLEYYRYYYVGDVADWEKHLNYFIDKALPFIKNKIQQSSISNLVFIKKNSFDNDIENIEVFRKQIKSNGKVKNKKEEIIDYLLTNKNVILHGAPGTGKTYLAKSVGQELTNNKDNIQFVQFHPSFDYTDFIEGIKPISSEDEDGNIQFERMDGVFKSFCKHVIKDNSDSIDNFEESWNKLLDELQQNAKKTIVLDTGQEFVLNDYGTGLRSINMNYNIYLNKLKLYYRYKNNAIRIPNYIYYQRVLDIMKKDYGLLSYKYSDVNSDKKYVFIIDEINRGEISKIFGELFYSLDEGYRGKNGRIKTQYNNLVEDGDEFKEGFYVPENVYIIGTMNDIDRSVESLDFAIRRRFCFIKIKPEDSIDMWHDKEWKDNAYTKMINLNECIKDLDELGEDFQIGAAYFNKLDNYNGDFDKLWEFHLMPLFEEYLRGLSNKSDVFERLKKAYHEETAEDEVDDDNDNIDN